MDHFWNCLSKDVGRISETIRHTLEVTEYINAALAFIGNEEIAAIEEDIRRLPEILNIPAGDLSLKKYHGRFLQNPERFRFMAGERAILKLIASCVQRKGINHYLRYAEKREKEVIVPGSLETSAAEVRRKVIDFYNERCDGTADQIDFCNRITAIRVDVSETDDGSLTARIGCLFCPGDNVITCRPERTGGSWKVSNFLAHIRNVHKGLNAPTSAPRTATGFHQPSTSPPVECGGEGSNLSSASGFQYDSWASSSDVTSSHENTLKRKYSGNSMEEFGFVVKEERFN
ncbi:uncharacterized protein LOC131689568 [Topomyia yanbarensis]|uniref:uncharacterized protein LOC131689568 n=1 Tax=Topomyia yanbarensis TaxID=2498891 RepID=UPI00273CEB1E|nr:uncharacterized protein LOC131689568 [Topomyia yanbarensis]